MKTFIFIPVVNGFDLLQKACASISNVYEESFILNNSGTVIPSEIYENTNFQVITPERPLSFINTMNWAIKKAIDEDYDFFAFMHNDGEVTNGVGLALKEKTESIINNGNDNVAIHFTRYDVYCTFITKLIKNVGFFGDEMWPNKDIGHHYLSDNDYYRRVALMNYQILDDGKLGDNVIHHGSMSIKNDEDFRKQSCINKNLAMEHYIKKWGGRPHEEKFTIPFTS
jgi:hypothetical protein